MNEEDWNRFLAWLNPDHDKAGLKYEDIRRNLIRILGRRGSLDAEELADKAFDRVIEHLPNIIETYIGEPAKYIIRVAINLYYERQKKPHPIAESEVKNSTRYSSKNNDENWSRERLHHCLDECLKELPDSQRELILDYYSKDKKQKIENRKRIAVYLGVSLNALALRVLRIRDTLESCLNDCLEDKKKYEINRAFFT